jgi:methylmalonyl-CoA mutase, N-terminal domain
LRVQQVRAERNSEAAMKALAEVENAARSGENLMPRIITAVESYATLGEIADAMRRVFGEYQDSM